LEQETTSFKFVILLSVDAKLAQQFIIDKG